MPDRRPELRAGGFCWHGNKTFHGGGERYGAFGYLGYLAC
ncbi:hypothetical protein SAMN04488087_0246 [Rhodothermus profundi]|uniref:Uncharacterized protein n=1 Tax=Rhodothermus profundi TaxID=633813 RepID=A0A1M6PMN3_9BACT|nr:hypothetical protein SAMN04488087_0246 [Rhodothermus profundi]